MGILKTVASLTALAPLLVSLHAAPMTGFNRDESSWFGVPQCLYDDFNGPDQPLCFTVNEAPGKHHLDLVLLWSKGTHARELPWKYVAR